jgi:hypothetical protein
MLSGRGLCDELITRPEQSTDCGASLCVIKKPRETRRPQTALGCNARENNDNDDDDADNNNNKNNKDETYLCYIRIQSVPRSKH